MKIVKPVKKGKRVFGLYEQYLFLGMFIIGAIIVQASAAWFGKNPFTLVNFAWFIPLLVVSQYFIMAGYHDGVAIGGYVNTFILWTAALVVVTLGVNYVMLGNIPGPWTAFALVLVAVASVIAASGK